MRQMMALAAAALMLAACDQNAGNAFKASFDKSFNASFDKSTHDSCVTAATGKGGAPDAVERYCSCVITQLDKLTTEEKMKLNQEPDKLTAAAQACQPGSTPSS